LKRDAEALKEWDRIVALEDGYLREFRRSERLVVLARLGEHARATAEDRALADQALAAAGEALDRALYNLAGVYALSGDAARSDARLAPAERAALAEKYAAAAVKLLQQVRARGFFQNPYYIQE